MARQRDRALGPWVRPTAPGEEAMGLQGGACTGTGLDSRESGRGMRLPEACCSPVHSVVPLVCDQSPSLTSCLRAFAQAGVQPRAPYSGVLNLSHLHKSASCSAFRATRAREWRRGRRDSGRIARQRALRARRTPVPRGGGDRGSARPWRGRGHNLGGPHPPPHPP